MSEGRQLILLTWLDWSPKHCFENPNSYCLTSRYELGPVCLLSLIRTVTLR